MFFQAGGVADDWANCPARSDSDEARQFVGKRAGSAAAVAQEGAKRRLQPLRRPASIFTHCKSTPRGTKESGHPQAARLVLAEARSPF
jgi:hypothetical protein